MKKVKCCFNINTLRIIKNNKNASIVEIAKSSKSANRDIVINHFAVKMNDKRHTMNPVVCSKCRSTLCSSCQFSTCSFCDKRRCTNCFEKCFICEENVCGKCSRKELGYCVQCRELCCSSCFGNDGESNYCEGCYDEDEAAYYRRRRFQY